MDVLLPLQRACNVDGDGKHHCPCVPSPPPPSYVFARPLSNGNVAVVVHNADSTSRTLGFDFASVPDRSWGHSTTLKVRDLWEHQDLGKYTGHFSASIPAHGVSFVVLSQ